MAAPRKIEVRSLVKDGNLVQNRKDILDAIQQFEGKEVILIIKRFFKQRSNKQNGYYFGVIVEHWKKILREEWGEVYTKQAVHEFLKSNLNYEEVADEETGELYINPSTGRPVYRPKSTTENLTIEQEDYHEACRQLAWNMFQYEIPLPEKQLKATYS